MKTENKIIKLFIEDKNPKTIREISKNIKSDYKITHTATIKLIKKNVLISKTFGKSKVCELNPVSIDNSIINVEKERKENLLNNKNIKQLYKEITSKIKTKFFILLIFGSYAKQKQTKNSDIDIMVISNEKAFEFKIIGILSLLPIKTHAFVFTENEFKKMKDSKELNVVKGAIDNNIVLYGIENFYRLKND